MWSKKKNKTKTCLLCSVSPISILTVFRGRKSLWIDLFFFRCPTLSVWFYILHVNVQTSTERTFSILWISENLFYFCGFVSIPIKTLMYFPVSVAFIETWAMLPTLSSSFLCYSPAQRIFLFLKHLYRNKSVAYKWICSDVPSSCKQHKADKFLWEIKELGYVGKGVHWRQSSCSRVFWTFIYHLLLHKRGIIVAVFHSHQRPHSFPNCYQFSGIRSLAYACAV